MSADARGAGLAPRIALVRSRYDPSGGAERFVQGAVAALKSQGASLTIVTRHWPDHDGSAIVLDPFYVGSLWRDLGFARAVCAELARRRFDLVQSHERIACCDVCRSPRAKAARGACCGEGPASARVPRLRRCAWRCRRSMRNSPCAC